MREKAQKRRKASPFLAICNIEVYNTITFGEKVLIESSSYCIWSILAFRWQASRSESPACFHLQLHIVEDIFAMMYRLL